MWPCCSIISGKLTARHRNDGFEGLHRRAGLPLSVTAMGNVFAYGSYQFSALQR